MKKLPNSKFSLKIDASRVPADKFLKAINSFLGLLRNVSDEATGERDSVIWLVDVEPGSVVINACPYSTTVDIRAVAGIAKTIRSGIKSLEKSDRRPEYFSDTALHHARELASVLSDKDKIIDKVIVRGFGTVTSISQHMIANVDGILSTTRTEDGSVEGRVSVLSDRRKFEVQIDDILTGHSVRCIADGRLEEKLIDSFRKRVVVSGRVHYRKDGLPVSIDVADVRPIGGVRLPKFSDVRGILRK